MIFFIHVKYMELDDAKDTDVNWRKFEGGKPFKYEEVDSMLNSALSQILIAKKLF